MVGLAGGWLVVGWWLAGAGLVVRELLLVILGNAGDAGSYLSMMPMMLAVLLYHHHILDLVKFRRAG